MTASCEACYALIDWLPNERTGRKAPIDHEPNPKGNVVITSTGHYRVLTKAQLAQPTGDLFGEEQVRYTSHFATCTDPQHFRRCQVCHDTPCRCAGRPTGLHTNADIDRYVQGREHR